ncbi:MAG: HD domain-containing protein [Saccharofermentanales bacterium]
MMKTGQVIQAMIGYYAGDVGRINHFIKVYGFAKAIGEMERLDDETLQTLEIAALTHDIGIKNSEIRYGSSDGKYQEKEGPPEAEKLLGNLNIASETIVRVCWLIAHHHTYNDIQGIDHQILVEADFLVNAHEGDMSPEAIKSIREKIFRTKTGKEFIDAIFGT